MTLTNALSLFSLLASLSAPAPLDVLRDHAAAVHGVDPALLAGEMGEGEEEGEEW